MTQTKTINHVKKKKKKNQFISNYTSQKFSKVVFALKVLSTNSYILSVTKFKNAW